MLSQIFKAYDIRATYPEPLNEDAAWKVGCATGRFLKKQNADKPGDVLVSRDMRLSSASLAKSLSEGLRASGMNVVDLGMCDTSFIYFAINYLKAAGGVQTTASHNPANYNGFKISGAEARPIGATTGLVEIQTIAESLGQPGSLKPAGAYSQKDLWSEYRTHVHKFLKLGKRKLKVYIDASNGMAGKMVPAVFDGVPGLEIVRLNFEITGKFVHEPNPLVPANMVPTQAGVKQTRADMGACFDGDADRCMFTDESGQVIACDHLTALLSGPFLRQAPGAAVIYDLRSSKCVEETIRALGGVPHRSRVGHVFMKALLRQTDAIFGGELSGHFYFRDNFYADSGAIAFAAVASLLSQSDQPLGKLVAPFNKYPQSGEINFQTPDKAKVIADIKAKYASGGAIDELDGVTVDAWAKAGFWFNVRASNTEPLLRLNAEARDRATLDKTLAQLKPMLGTESHGH